MNEEQGLKKSLDFKDLVFMGLGCVVGSGVFVILGKTILYGGRYTILAFIIISILSIVMGYCYLEIYSRYKSDIMEYLAIKDNLGSKIGTMSLYLIYLFSVFSAITVVISITKYISNHGYLPDIFGGSKSKEIMFSIFLITIMTIINYIGIKTSTVVCNSIGVIMLIILVGIIVLGGNKFCIEKVVSGPETSWDSFVLCTILALFLFNGYDVIVKMSSETKHENDTKRALLTTIILTTVIYLAVIVISICVLGYDTVSQSYHPLSNVYETLVGHKVALVTYVAGIFILFNTAFVSLIGATRFMYGLGQKKEIAYAEKWCELSENKTPKYAILLTYILSIILALVNNEVVMAVFCNFSVMLILILLSISLLMIRWKERNNIEEQKKHNYIKGNINNIPLIVLISMVVMIFFKYTILKNKFWLK